MMTRKDYIKTAEIISAVQFFVNDDVAQFLINNFADYFQADNERFDRQRFIQACTK